jgi:type IV pilus assembly protein PilW
MTTLPRKSFMRRASKHCESGLSLIELLVALTISGLLIFGATQVYVDSRRTYDVNERAARLQETARYAMSVLEPDIRMSNYWGLVKGAGVLSGQALPTEPQVPGDPTACGTNFTRHLVASLSGTNGSSTFPCTAYRATAVASADTLTVKRASVAPSDPSGTRLRICSTRVMGTVLTDASTCTTPPAGQVNDLIVNSYYISQNSTDRPGFPSLRRVALIDGPTFRDEEIIPGVEDMQIEFGVDPTGTTGRAARYVSPDEVNPGEQIVSVRIWLLIRSDEEEVGFRDDRTYQYADREAYQPNDRYRRLLVSRTIQVRNALGT